MCETTYDMTYTDLNPRFLYSCIQERKEPTERHCHEFVELHVILKGYGKMIIDDREYEVREGDIIILNPGAYHHSVVEVGEPLRIEYHIAFTDVEFKNCPHGHMPLFKNYQLLAHMPDGMKTEVFHLCKEMDREAAQWECGRYFMLKAYLIQILCLIGRYQKQEWEEEEKKKVAVGCSFQSVNKKYIIEKITEYMESHYMEKISLDQIADNMYLSSYYISKIFKKETGDTPINYLISLRMKKAKELLEKYPDRSIQSVAADVGYEDAYHFSKLFKKYYGISPLYYKARLP